MGIRLKQYGFNKATLRLDEKAEVFFSFGVPIAAFVGSNLFVVDREEMTVADYVTRSAMALHLQWYITQHEPARAIVLPQVFFENMLVIPIPSLFIILEAAVYATCSKEVK